MRSLSWGDGALGLYDWSMRSILEEVDSNEAHHLHGSRKKIEGGVICSRVFRELIMKVLLKSRDVILISTLYDYISLRSGPVVISLLSRVNKPPAISRRYSLRNELRCLTGLWRKWWRSRIFITQVKTLSLNLTAHNSIRGVLDFPEIRNRGDWEGAEGATQGEVRGCDHEVSWCFLCAVWGKEDGMSECNLPRKKSILILLWRFQHSVANSRRSTVSSRYRLTCPLSSSTYPTSSRTLRAISERSSLSGNGMTRSSSFSSRLCFQTMRRTVWWNSPTGTKEGLCSIPTMILRSLRGLKGSRRARGRRA